MRLACIACEVLARPLYLSAALSPHIVDIELLRKGLHANPADLRARLQGRIDTLGATQPAYDAIVVGYGLCGQATAGLTAPGAPLVIPRAHDCITLFLGSRASYQYQFENFPGTYWYALDYVERNDGGSLSLGSGADVEASATYDKYVQKYGKDNADYLMEVMGAWQQHYRRAVLIDIGVGDITPAASRAASDAARRGWQLERMAGDLVLIRRLLNGDWGENDFLVLQPGQKIAPTYDDRVIGPAVG